MHKYVVEVLGRKLLVVLENKNEIITQTLSQLERKNVEIPPHSEVILECFFEEMGINEYCEIELNDLPES